MLEATDFSIFKGESISEYTDSLSEYCRFCFNTPYHLETIYVSATNVSSPHLNRLRRKEESCFKNGQKQRLSRADGDVVMFFEDDADPSVSFRMDKKRDHRHWRSRLQLWLFDTSTPINLMELYPDYSADPLSKKKNNQKIKMLSKWDDLNG